MKPIKVMVNGAQGKMGQETVKALQQTEDLALVAALHRPASLKEAIYQHQADVVIDFTAPESVYDNTYAILAAGACPVIGTTGLSLSEIEQLQRFAHEQQKGGLIAPNFSIGAILVMRFAAAAAQYYDYVEIIEKHHEQKKDAPSGTALKAAENIAKLRKNCPKEQTEREMIAGSRGARYQDIPIHAVRMPGLVAHLQVLFGDKGETLTLSHDSIDRSCFMPGVLLACREVVQRTELLYGLENVL